MSLNFQDISLERQADYNAIFAQCPGKASDYNFINIWGWAEEYGLKWAWEKDLVWITKNALWSQCRVESTASSSTAHQHCGKLQHGDKHNEYALCDA